MKVNINGAAKGNLKMATCGGLIKDSTGKWISGFFKKLGICLSFMVELQGIVQGLELAWSRGMQNIELESDS